MKNKIKNWDELKECKSETHYLVISNNTGFAVPNVEVEDGSYFKGAKYLSTNTFDKSQQEYSTKLLKKCGFDIIIGEDTNDD